MEYPVVHQGETVGSCVMEDVGLYWQVACSCRLFSDRVERLYCGDTRLGVLEKEGERLLLRRRLSKSAYPMLPPRSGFFALEPAAEAEPWQGYVMGYALKGFRKENRLLFPYDPNGPCPCEPLFCFFEICDGFWRLPYPLFEA